MPLLAVACSAPLTLSLSASPLPCHRYSPSPPRKQLLTFRELHCQKMYVPDTSLSLLDHGSLRFLPSLVAASVVFVSRYTIDAKSHPWGVTGKYFGDCNEEDTSNHAKYEELATKLWDLSEKMVNTNEQSVGIVKILKKYDKRTGALIRQPFIEKVLQQPFFTTDPLYKLVKECVAMLDHLFPSNNLSISAECDGQNGVPKPAQLGGRVPELEKIKYMQSLYMKSTVAALRSLKHIRSKSSTVKTD
ncbi:SPX domain-containing protein 2-like [Zingiber officinale]|uniref:SPX domain-containing protein 2-like n=1 Tax=Zingiber officinale TaxID=94328 RepID=UPI001C4D8DC7|nr:SPX domain-containing protein 2-like [Zingiber officinale]